MDSREGMNSGVTVIGAEAPSSYHMAPRAENSTTPVAGAPAVTPSPVSAGLTGTLEKKKRGRPRKYGPEGTSSRQMSPMPISASAPPPVTVNFSADKPSGGRPSVSEKKQRHKIAHDDSGDLVQSSSGGNFAPHTIRINTGEDITMKIISFSQQGPRSVCILSAMGFISNVTLRQPDSSGGTLTYEGRFEILSLSGSFTPTEIVGGSRVSRCGGMSITLISPDGRIIGGQLAGLLIAASPVDLLVGSFLPSNHQELRPKRHKYEFKHVPTAVPAATVHAPNVEQNYFNAQDHQNNSVCHSQNYAASVTPFQSENNWTIMPTSQDSRKSTTDINIALKE